MSFSERRLRVAYVYRHFDNSGSIPSFYTRNAERLACDEDVTAVCAQKGRKDTTAPLRFLDVNPLVEGSGRFRYATECLSFAIASSSRMRSLRDSFDVVHVEGFAGLTADLVSVHAVRPAESEHYWGSVEPDAWFRKRVATLLRPQSGVVMGIERRLFRAGHRPYCMAPTRAIKADLERVYGVPDHMVSVVPYGIDSHRFGGDVDLRARVRARVGVPDDRTVFVFIGDGFERKGLARAIEALAKVSGDAELWVVGGSAEQVETYRAVAVRAGVAARVRFHGRSGPEAVPGWYAAADALVLLSQQDSWGHTVIEAFASSRPVLVSEYVGASEVVRDGETGFVIRGMGDPGEAARLMSGPLADPVLRRAMGDRARSLAREYDREVIYPKFREAHWLAYEARLARAL